MVHSPLPASIDVARTLENWIDRPTSGGGLWLTTIVLLVLLWIGLYAWDRHRRPSATAANNDPEGLFRDLCQLHRLDIRDQELLSQLARRHYPEQPALVFVDPRPWATEEDESTRRLREKLFGPEPQSSGSGLIGGPTTS